MPKVFPYLTYLSEAQREAAIQDIIDKAIDDAQDATQKHFEQLKAELELTLKR